MQKSGNQEMSGYFEKIEKRQLLHFCIIKMNILAKFHLTIFNYF